MRYFLTLSYRGTRYCGWQRQPADPSVQETLEKALSTIIRQPIEITGCGRTDAGVHARYYVAHFDAAGELPPTLLQGLNSILPNDIAIADCQAVHADAHARYDAFSRSYEYHISFRKDPFLYETAWFFPQYKKLDIDRMQAVADLLPRFQEFYPFCKTHSGVDSYACQISRAEWVLSPDNQSIVFHISANRFLRGMVRLIVGASLYSGLGKISADDIRQALETQRSIKNSHSVPPEGLFLTDVKYPYPF